MAWWGKVVGGAFGFMLGGPLGALLGAALGHNFDKGLIGIEQSGPADRERIQTAFFTATFTVMGHLAKADGRVSPEEIALAEAVMAEMDLTPEQRKAAIALFNQGKAADFPLDETLDQFRRECRRRATLIQMFLEIQIQAAYADGRMDKAEERVLLHVCERLGIPRFVFDQLRRMVEAHRRAAGAGRGRYAGREAPKMGLDDAYAILNLSPDASDAEVKKAYRRLMSRHHPDKLISKGLPEEMMKMAQQKTAEIRKAYERIKRERGL